MAHSRLVAEPCGGPLWLTNRQAIFPSGFNETIEGRAASSLLEDEKTLAVSDGTPSSASQWAKRATRASVASSPRAEAETHGARAALRRVD